MQRFAKVFCKKRFAGVARVESSQGAEFARLVEAGARVAVLFCKACVCVGVARLAVFARVCGSKLQGLQFLQGFAKLQELQQFLQGFCGSYVASWGSCHVAEKSSDFIRSASQPGEGDTKLSVVLSPLWWLAASLLLLLFCSRPLTNGEEHRRRPRTIRYWTRQEQYGIGQDY